MHPACRRSPGRSTPPGPPPPTRAPLTPARPRPVRAQTTPRRSSLTPRRERRVQWDPERTRPPPAGWAPGAAGSFEEHEPFDRPAGASDRWREAKLAAERDRIARAAAAQPEERSPLERARRRLERLVGGGQDDPDSDEVSPADREAAERARRARLGLDD